MSLPPGFDPNAEPANLVVERLARDAFLEAERRFAYGTPFEAAKQEVLEERVPGIVEEHGGEIADQVILQVMEVRESGTHPKARKAFRNRAWMRIVGPGLERGAAPPTWLERRLFDWWGSVPSRFRT